MKTPFRTTLAAMAFTIASAANFASLPSAALIVSTGLLLSGEVIASPSSGVRSVEKPVSSQASPSSAEKGIKDPAVKGCGNCGITGKAAAPATGVGEGSSAPSTEGKKCSGQWVYAGDGMCMNPKGIKKPADK